MKLRERSTRSPHKTAQTYLRILEQRALVALSTRPSPRTRNLARIIQAHAREGHGTVADVQRVSSRLVDIRAIRSDVSLQLMAAEDAFERLTRARPGRLAPAPLLTPRIPAGRSRPSSACWRTIHDWPRFRPPASPPGRSWSTTRPIFFQDQPRDRDRIEELPQRDSLVVPSSRAAR